MSGTVDSSRRPPPIPGPRVEIPTSPLNMGPQSPTSGGGGTGVISPLSKMAASGTTPQTIVSKRRPTNESLTSSGSPSVPISQISGVIGAFPSQPPPPPLQPPHSSGARVMPQQMLRTVTQPAGGGGAGGGGRVPVKLVPATQPAMNAKPLPAGKMPGKVVRVVPVPPPPLRSQQQPPGSRKSSAGTTTVGFKLGERVRVDSMNVEGTLRYLGPINVKPGLWAGVEMDQVGSGKNDGSVGGVSYFNCPPQTGIFVLAGKLTSLNPASFASMHPNEPDIFEIHDLDEVGPLRSPPRKPSEEPPRMVHAKRSSHASMESLMSPTGAGVERGGFPVSPPTSGRPLRVNITGRAPPSHPSAGPMSPPESILFHATARRVSLVDPEEYAKLKARLEVVEAENRLLKVRDQQQQAQLAASEMLDRGVVVEAQAALEKTGEVAALRERVDALEAERSRLEAEKQELENEMMDVKSRRGSALTTIGEADEQTLRLTELIQQKDRKIRELETAHAAHQQRIKDLEDALAESDHALQAKEQIEMELRNALQERKGSMFESLQTTLEELEVQLEAKAIEMGKLSARLDRSSTEHEKEKTLLKERITLMETQDQDQILERVQTELAQEKQLREQLEQDQQQLQAEMQRLTTAVTEAIEIGERASEQVEMLRTENERLAADLSKLTQREQEALEGQSRAQRSLEASNMELEANKMELVLERERLRKAEAEMDKLRSGQKESKELQLELAEMTQRYVQAHDTQLRLSEACQRLEEEHKTLQGEMMRMMDEMDARSTGYCEVCEVQGHSIMSCPAMVKQEEENNWLMEGDGSGSDEVF